MDNSIFLSVYPPHFVTSVLWTNVVCVAISFPKVLCANQIKGTKFSHLTTPYLCQMPSLCLWWYDVLSEIPTFGKKISASVTI